MGSELWTWDPRKDTLNKQKHKLSFENAIRVFELGSYLTQADPCDWEQRWQTVGLVQGVCIFVVHTEPDFDGRQVLKPGRIISARKATKGEREAFYDEFYG